MTPQQWILARGRISAILPSGELFSQFSLGAAASLVADAMGFESIPGLGYTGPTVRVRNSDDVEKDCVSPIDVMNFVGYKPWYVVNFYSQITGDVCPGSTVIAYGNTFNGVMCANAKTSGFLFPQSRMSTLSDRPSMAGYIAWSDTAYGSGMNADLLWMSTGTSATTQRMKITTGLSSARQVVFGGRNLDATNKSGVTPSFTNKYSTVGLVTHDFVGGPIRYYQNGVSTPAYENLNYFSGGINCSATAPLTAGCGAKTLTNASSPKGAGFIEGILFHTAPTGAALDAINARAAAIADYIDNTELKIIDDGCNTGFSSPLSINLGSKTLLGTVSARGQQRLYQIDNATQAIDLIKVVSDTFSGKDDHNTPAIIVTPGGGLLTAFTGHGKENKIRWIRTSSQDVRDFGNESVLLVSGPTAAYTQLFTHGTDIYRITRLGNTWRAFKSTDDGITFTGEGIPLVTSTEDQMYMSAVRVGANKVRLLCQPNSLYYDTSFRIAEWDISTGSITSGSGVLVADIVATPIAPSMEDMSYVAAPVTGFKNSFLSISEDGSAIVSQVANNAFTSATYMYYKLTGTDPFDSASWTETIVSTAGAAAGGRWVGRIEIINTPGLTNPRVVLGRNDGTKFRLEQYDAGNVNGTSWTLTTELDSGSSEDDQVTWRPYSPANASADFPVWWQKGWYSGYTNYKMKIKWKVD